MDSVDGVHVERLAACGVDTYRVGRTCYSCAAVSGSAGVALFFVLVPFVLALFIWLVTHDPRRGQAPLAISMRFLESLALLQYVDIRWPGRGQWLFHIAGLTNLDGFVFPLSCVLRPLSTAELLAVPLVINGAFDGSLPAGRRTASLIRDAEHVVIEDAGHACCIEKPQAFDAAIIDFLARNGLAPDSAGRS